MNFLNQIFRKQPKIEKVDIPRRFELITRVGQGSMSKVWRARDAMTGRVVAIKVLDKAKLARLERRFVGMPKPTEGEIAVVLKHPNLVRTTECGITTDDEQFLVMEFIEGVGLSYLIDSQSERMRKNRLWYLVQLGEAIDYLHRHNWIHRDVCPRNVLVTEEECIKLIDFGLMVPNTEVFRAPGNRTGSANYMAPELIKRLRTDERIDVFSFAVTAYESFTRKMPWPAGDTLESVMQHINKPPHDVRELAPDIDDGVADAIMKGLEPDPDRRWPSARKMTQALEEAAARLGQLPERGA